MNSLVHVPEYLHTANSAEGLLAMQTSYLLSTGIHDAAHMGKSRFGWLRTFGVFGVDFSFLFFS